MEIFQNILIYIYIGTITYNTNGTLINCRYSDIVDCDTFNCLVYTDTESARNWYTQKFYKDKTLSTDDRQVFVGGYASSPNYAHSKRKIQFSNSGTEKSFMSLWTKAWGSDNFVAYQPTSLRNAQFFNVANFDTSKARNRYEIDVNRTDAMYIGNIVELYAGVLTLSGCDRIDVIASDNKVSSVYPTTDYRDYQWFHGDLKDTSGRDACIDLRVNSSSVSFDFRSCLSGNGTTVDVKRLIAYKF